MTYSTLDGTAVAGSDTATAVETPINTGFDSSATGFSYVDDAFRSTNESNYADGTWGAGLGESGGGLRVVLGGLDDADITDMSGGWQTTFNVSANSTGTLSFRYNMTLASPNPPAGTVMCRKQRSSVAPSSTSTPSFACGDSSPANGYSAHSCGANTAVHTCPVSTRPA